MILLIFYLFGFSIHHNFRFLKKYTHTHTHTHPHTHIYFPGAILFTDYDLKIFPYHLFSFSWEFSLLIILSFLESLPYSDSEYYFSLTVSFHIGCSCTFKKDCLFNWFINMKHTRPTMRLLCLQSIQKVSNNVVQ